MSDMQFTENEVLLMYYEMKHHVDEGNDMLDSDVLSGSSRNEIIENLKVSNSVLRKLRHTLNAVGINPDDIQA